MNFNSIIQKYSINDGQRIQCIEKEKKIKFIDLLALSTKMAI